MKKLAGFCGHGKWGREGSKLHVNQLRENGFQGIKIKHHLGKKAYTVYYSKKGKGPPCYDYNKGIR